MILLTVLSFIFVLGIAILFHEFGHFITAKAAGVKVFSFALGFGPKIVGFYWKGTEYKLCMFPFGGYVKMAGEDSSEENNDDKQNKNNIPDNQRFDKKPFSIRAAVIINGPIMNIVLATILLAIVFFFTGQAEISNKISEVSLDSPAGVAGLQNGDTIIEINEKVISNAEEITKIINESLDEELMITVMRENEKLDFYLFPEYNAEHGRAMIGITLDIDFKKISIFSALNKSFAMTKEILILIGKSFSEMITGTMPVELAGPLGIAQMAGEAARVGFLNLLFFAAVINIFLGVINLLPIPIMDGGQILLLIIEKIRKKPLEPEHINFLYLAGTTLVVMIFLIATYQDIIRIFTD